MRRALACICWLFAIGGAAGCSKGARDSSPGQPAGEGGQGGTPGGGTGGLPGTGGAAGTGGAGGTASADDSWIWDTTKNWQPVPGSEFLEPSCRAWTSTVSQLDSLAWESCGAGCDVAVFPSQSDEKIAFPALSTGNDGKIYLAVTQARKSETETAYLRRWVRVSDGATSAILQLRANVQSGYVNCALTYQESGLPATGFNRAIDQNVQGQLGLLEEGANGIGWSKQLDVTALAACSVGTPVESARGHDWIFACPSSVRIAKAGESTVDNLTGDHTTAISAARNRAVWTDLPSDGSPSRIVVFEPDASPQQAGAIEGDACGVDVTQRGVATIVGTGPSTADYCQTTYETLRFAGIEENAQSEWEPPSISGPISSVPAAVEAFKSTGDYYVALLRDTVGGGTDLRKSWLVVGRGSDWAMHRIDPPNGGFFHRFAVALDGSFVYAVEIEFGAANYDKFGRLYRFALASMDFVEPVR